MKMFTTKLCGKGQGRSGFTLVELLASMAVLSIIVLMVSRIFADTSKIWRLGVKRVESNTDGRLLIDFMSRELSSLIADDTLEFYQDSDQYGFDVVGRRPDSIFFASNANESLASGQRQVMQVSYYMDNMQDATSTYDLTNRFLIRRDERKNDGAMWCYTNSSWASNGSMMAGNQELAYNVRTIEFWVYDAAGTYHANYKASQFGPPAWIEIYLEMLGADDAVKLSYFPPNSAQAIAYADRVSKRYVGRVYMNHAVGHARDK